MNAIKFSPQIMGVISFLGWSNSTILLENRGLYRSPPKTLLTFVQWPGLCDCFISLKNIQSKSANKGSPVYPFSNSFLGLASEYLCLLKIKEKKFNLEGKIQTYLVI